MVAANIGHGFAPRLGGTAEIGDIYKNDVLSFKFRLQRFHSLDALAARAAPRGPIVHNRNFAFVVRRNGIEHASVSNLRRGLDAVGGFFGQTLQRSFQFLVVGTRKSLHGLWQGGNLFVRNCLHFANPLFYVDYPFDFCAPLAERRQFQSVGAGVGIRRAGII